MIVVLPLMIAGTTFAAYYSIDATIAFDIYTNRTCTAEGAFAKVYANDKEVGHDAEIVDGHLKNVTFQAEAEGYDFVGWFEGDEQSYAIAHRNGNVEFVSQNATFEIGMSEYQTLLAVFEIKEYTISYNYTSTPNGALTTVVPEAGADKLTWGDALPTLSYSGYDAVFAGWREVGTQNKPTMIANFDKEAVTLEAVWKNQGVVTVHYQVGDTLYRDAAVYQFEPYTVREIDHFSPEKKAGYAYSWVDENGNKVEEGFVTAFETGDVVTYYLNEEIISYTATVSSEDLTYAKNPVVKFTIEDTKALDDLFDAQNWAGNYSFYTFAGVSYNGSFYSTAKEFANAVAAGDQTTVNVNAVANKMFRAFAVESAVKGRVGFSTLKVYKGADFGEVEWSVPVAATESDNTLADLLYLKDGDNAIKLYTDDNGQKVELAIKGVEVQVGGMMFSIYEIAGESISGETVLNDLIEEILADVEVAESSDFVLSGLTIIFEKI